MSALSYPGVRVAESPLASSLQTLVAAGLASARAEAIAAWLEQPAAAEDREALATLVERGAAGDQAAQAELDDAFSRPLPIGTGGRRGPCGPGPNRVNGSVMRQSALGLLTAMQDTQAWGTPAGPRSVAIAYDTRASSRQFAHTVARQLIAGGVAVVLLDAPRPTPQLSFSVRRRGCAAGIVISASHNPPGDNGIKIYGPDGAQVAGERDTRLFAGIEAAAAGSLAPLSDTGWLSPGADPAAEVLQGEALAAEDRPYHAFVRAQGVAPAGWGAGLRMVYTPLHGVGHTAVVPVLANTGVALHLVERQCDPDGGRFSTVASANPEVPASMDMAAALAQEVDAQLVVASDPDADRMGALVRDDSGALVPLDGNRLAVLMVDHVLRHVAADGAPPNTWALQTVVSSPLVAKLCRAHGVEVVDDLLTGFKHHAAMMEEQPDKAVLFMFEEAHGYMRGNDVHDKDGAVAARLMAECVAQCHAQGKTVFDSLRRIWAQHGYHRERTENLWAYGGAGREAIAAAVDAFRREPPQRLGGLAVRGLVDRAIAPQTDSPTRNLTSNVLVFSLADDDGRACTLVVRPSGTEPKAKIYALACSAGGHDAAALQTCMAEVDATLEAVLRDAVALAQAVMAPLLAESG